MNSQENEPLLLNENYAFLRKGFDEMCSLICEHAIILGVPRVDEDHPAGMDGFEAANHVIRECAAIKLALKHIEIDERDQ